MVYISVADGMTTNYKFMRSPNNVIFTSAYALFDENMFPKCEGTKKYNHKRFTPLRADEQSDNPQRHLRLQQPQISGGSDDEFFEQSSSHNFHPAKGKDKERDVTPEPPRTPDREVWTPSPTPHSAQPEQTPIHQRFRCSKCVGRVPVCEGNIYGETRHPVHQFQDIEKESSWERVIKSPNRYQVLEEREENLNPIPPPPEFTASFRNNQAPSQIPSPELAPLGGNTELAK
jgi:hypothetical protein